MSKMSSPWSVFNSVNRTFARKTSNATNPLTYCPLMSSDPSSRNDTRGNAVVASSLPLLSEAASATELLQQQQLHEDQHEAHFSEDPVGSQEQQDFSNPSQHWHDDSLQQEHHREDLFEPQHQVQDVNWAEQSGSMQRGSSINNTTPKPSSTNFSTSASFNNIPTNQEQQQLNAVFTSQQQQHSGGNVLLTPQQRSSSFNNIAASQQQQRSGGNAMLFDSVK